MVDPLNAQSAMMREAIAAAQARIAAQRAAVSPSASPSDFGQALAAGGPATQGLGALESVLPSARTPATPQLDPVGAIESVNDQVMRAEALGEDLVTGKVQDLHEVAAQLKRADLTFKFSLQVRDRLIDAYREVMRMGV